MNYKQGSDWRKWDLHVHTPLSIENSYKGSSIEEKWENFISDIEKLPSEIKVLGINDYLFIDGYRKLVEFKNNGRLKNIDTLFPVIEFRIRKFAGHKDFKRVNFHVIFSDFVTTDIIQNQFLNSLQSKYKLSPGLDGIKWNASITKESLEDLGKKIKANIPKEQLKHYGSDLIEGFNNLNLDEDEIMKLLSDNSYLKENYLLAVGKTEWESLSWNDSSIAEKKDIINKVDFVFISSETPGAYENAKGKLMEQAVNSKLLDCSDAHHNINSDYKDRLGKCFTWIKADTSFEGLRQVLYEFEDRVFIGDFPISKENVETNPTKYIKSLKVKKDDNSSIPEDWFNDMPEMIFNSNLVAIIGNKGSGKSAIADILGLVGNSHSFNDFSFLNKKKFLKPKPYNRSEAFSASITWQSGFETDFICLSENVDYSINEKVKYLPQNFIETICSEDIDNKQFENELKTVVFSHMDDTQKLDKSTFDEYIEYKTSEINKKINRLKNTLHEINFEIEPLELKQHPDYLKKLEDKIKNKEDELNAHNQNKPANVKKPDADEELKKKQEKITTELNKLQKNELEIAENIEKQNSKKKTLNLEITDIENFNQALDEIERQNLEFKEEYEEKLKTYEIDFNKVFTYEIKKQITNQKIKTNKKILQEINDNLDIEKEGSLLYQQKQIKNQIKELKKQLTEPFRLYQKYLEQIEEWKKRENEIIGNKDKKDTIKYYEEQIRFVKEDLEKELSILYDKRYNTTRNIFACKQEIIDLYKQAYSPVTELIKDNHDIMKEYQIQFEASLKLSGFISKFFYHISQSSKGSFSGKQEGYNQLINIVEESSFDDFSKINEFISKIEEKLNYDQREGRESEKRYLSEQLRKEISSVDFCNFLYGLDYLETTYLLQLGGKSLTELSPGERGALLLIFYLLLDKGDIPLIIDQPEENLDNQSVYNILVKFIKKAKIRRQVIIVTHNPNLAVVSDAEQLIRVHIEKENKNKFSYISGAIENEEINSEIVKILEGTKPAFTNRKLKYDNIANKP